MLPDLFHEAQDVAFDGKGLRWVDWRIVIRVPAQRDKKISEQGTAPGVMDICRPVQGMSGNISGELPETVLMGYKHSMRTVLYIGIDVRYLPGTEDIQTADNFEFWFLLIGGDPFQQEQPFAGILDHHPLQASFRTSGDGKVFPQPDRVKVPVPQTVPDAVESA
jgi:hypothetical protein